MEMQRSLQGCLRTLLNQLLHALPHEIEDLLKRQWDPLWTMTANKRTIDDWSIRELLSTTKYVLNNISRRACLFLDGLDEFVPRSNEDDILQIVTDLGSIPSIKLCLSNREEPRFKDYFTKVSKLRLQNLTQQDMHRFIRAELLRCLSSSQRSRRIGQLEMEEICQIMEDKAEGVFLWAALATKSIQQGLTNGDDWSDLKQRVERFPRHLTEFYKQMWARLSEDDKGLYQRDIELHFAFSDHLPMDLLKCTLAINSPLRDRCLGIARFDESTWDELYHECISVERRLFSRTAGLLECTHREAEGRTDADDDQDFDKFMAQRQRAVRQELATETYPESGLDSNSDCPLHERPAVGVCEIIGELTRSGPSLVGDINFVHRSASQFFHQEILPSILSKDSLLTPAEVRNRVTEAFLGTYTMGCTCRDVVSWFLEEFLSPLRDPAQESTTPEAEEARNMLLRLLLVEDMIDQSQLTTRYTFGWYHRL